MVKYDREESYYFSAACWGGSFLGGAAAIARLEPLAVGVAIAIAVMIWRRGRDQRLAYVKYLGLCVAAGALCLALQRVGIADLGGAVMLFLVFLGFAAWWFWRELKRLERVMP